jgi:hypothetical protein
VRGGVSSDLVCKVQDGAGQAPQGELELKVSGGKFTMDVCADVINGPTLSASGSLAVPTKNVILGGSCKLDTKLDNRYVIFLLVKCSL